MQVSACIRALDGDYTWLLYGGCERGGNRWHDLAHTNTELRAALNSAVGSTEIMPCGGILRLQQLFTHVLGYKSETERWLLNFTPLEGGVWRLDNGDAVGYTLVCLRKQPSSVLLPYRHGDSPREDAGALTGGLAAVGLGACLYALGHAVSWVVLLAYNFAY